MTADTSVTTGDHGVAASARTSVARLLVGYGAIACAIPYLALKIVWLAGGQLGVADPQMMGERNMVVLNAMTAGMDLVGIGIALAFTHRWGRRLPTWLLLPPMWVATGLLVRFVAGVPVVLIAGALRTDSGPLPPGGPVEPWVYTLVYTAFTGMGVGLMLAFLLHARERWATLLQSPLRAVQPGATHIVQVPLANVAALLAMVVVGWHLAWLFGATMGLDAALIARRTLSSRLLDGIEAALVIAAAAGVLMLVHRVGHRTRVWVPVTMAWVGSGSLFAWGLWHLINVLGDTALIRERASSMALLNLVSLVRLIAGLVIGLVMLFVLAERRAAADRESQLTASPTAAP